jgi:hypothetical protein
MFARLFFFAEVQGGSTSRRLRHGCPGKTFARRGLSVTSPRKRGEVNPVKLLRKTSESRHSVSAKARMRQVLVANRNCFPGQPCACGVSAQRQLLYVCSESL